MSLFICSLNSGSNGNCYYVGNQDEAVLVDVGISCRELEKRMKRSGLNMSKVKAVFISHEHSDHVSGVSVTSSKYNIPVYITAQTLKNCRLDLKEELIRDFTSGKPVAIGNLEVIPFPKLHDAVDPFSFVVSGNGINIGVFTDIGSACENVVQHFKMCHAAFLEANYDVEMLEKGNYPRHLKNRISSDYGHLSNDQALELFLSHKSAQLTHVLLSHLSRENNDPETALDLFRKYSFKTEIIHASRFHETKVYFVTGKKSSLKRIKITADVSSQMSLFDLV